MSLKHFKTGNALRKYKKDGVVVEFEPLLYSEGSWVGVASFEEGTREAELLENFGPPVKSISASECESLKKKLKTNSPSSPDLPLTQEEDQEEETVSKEKHVADSVETELGFGTPDDPEQVEEGPTRTEQAEERSGEPDEEEDGLGGLFPDENEKER